MFTRFYEISALTGMTVENSIYNAACKLSEGKYSGGSWQVLVDNEDTFIVYPEVGDIEVGHVPNYVHPANITQEAFGAYCCLVVYNQLCWHYHAQGEQDRCSRFSSMYHSVRNWLLDTDTIPNEDVMHVMKMID
ncbi:hypothetical protein [Vibrio sp. ER1A]|uniref:hypothetical protein n=1 Tax=Vibrio sp. ER1A TaxID=1517681 RepID=UPI0004DCF537|nr:hypothetical protein [Vibrio sp. ER1A]KFA99270.1 hypothetical protein HW45_04825 [Vibrio sp. ER1A]